MPPEAGLFSDAPRFHAFLGYDHRTYGAVPVEEHFVDAYHAVVAVCTSCRMPVIDYVVFPGIFINNHRMMSCPGPDVTVGFQYDSDTLERSQRIVGNIQYFPSKTAPSGSAYQPSNTGFPTCTGFLQDRKPAAASAAKIIGWNLFLIAFVLFTCEYCMRPEFLFHAICAKIAIF